MTAAKISVRTQRYGKRTVRNLRGPDVCKKDLVHQCLAQSSPLLASRQVELFQVRVHSRVNLRHRYVVVVGITPAVSLHAAHGGVPLLGCTSGNRSGLVTPRRQGEE